MFIIKISFYKCISGTKILPDVNKIAVFNKGTSKGLIAWIPTGGQIAPNSIAGPKELWKKAQKKEKKKQTSERINNNIPHFNPL
jgi:hypothetical protein